MSTASAGETAALSQADWDQVHELVQALLAPLADHVARQLPGVRSAAGRTAARVWFLYSYREFLWPEEDEAEAVVVGVVFAPPGEGRGVCTSGDICGGETGHIYYEIEEREVLPTQDAVLAAAREIASQLAGQEGVVVSALRERRPPPDYRGGGVVK